MSWIFATVLLASLAPAEPDCVSLDAAANAEGTRIAGHLAVYQVTGTGHAQFYSAPSESCAMQGVFVIPKDRVIAYVEYRGFTAVMYVNEKNSTDTMGWVRSSRVRGTGTGISPE